MQQAAAASLEGTNIAGRGAAEETNRACYFIELHGHHAVTSTIPESSTWLPCAELGTSGVC